MSGKIRFPRALAIRAAKDLCDRLRSATVPGPDGQPMLKVCGSLRRRKAEVGDVELVYVPAVVRENLPPDLLGQSAGFQEVNSVDRILDELLRDGVLGKRLNKLGRTSWGDENKLAIHRETGIPVDLFSTNRQAWWGYVVCRTGSAESNTRIAAEALRRGWKWRPTSGCFVDVMGRRIPITSEADAFRLVGLPYLQPWER